MQFEANPEKSFEAMLRPTHKDGLFLIKSVDRPQVEVVKEIKASHKAGDELLEQEDAVTYGDFTGSFLTVPGVLYIGRLEKPDPNLQHDIVTFSGNPTATIIEVEPTDY